MSKIKKIKVFPFQLENIFLDKEKCSSDIVVLRGIQKESDANNTNEKIDGADILSAGISDTIILHSSQLATINSVLGNYEIVTEIDTTKIGVGTIFEAEILGDIEEYIIFGTLEGVKNISFEDLNIATVDSPMGASVIGKKIGESFTFKISSNGRDVKEISGRVVSIKENKYINTKQKTL